MVSPLPSVVSSVTIVVGAFVVVATVVVVGSVTVVGAVVVCGTVVASVVVAIGEEIKVHNNLMKKKTTFEMRMEMYRLE